MKLDGNVAIVTGGAQGIGEAYVRRFVREGARVAIADLNIEKAEALARELERSGGQTIAVKVDVSSEEDTRRMARAVADRWDRIDTLIANAAIYYDIDNTDRSFEYLRRIFSVNYFGVWLSARAVYPYMKRQGKGSIITQSSTAAYLHSYVAQPDDELPSFHYSSAKAAVCALTHFIAGAGGPHGVRCNSIAPGPTMTDATKKIVPEDILQMIVNAMMAIKHPLEADDLTGAAVFLASDDSSMITGQVLCVDGGMIMLG
jgi:3-oxoacyl-[acyl-carrier protein] reductase